MNEEGVVDFHSLRVTLCTVVNEANANPKQIQSLARHTETNLKYLVNTKYRAKRVENIVNQIFDTIQLDLDQIICEKDTEGQHQSAMSYCQMLWIV